MVGGEQHKDAAVVAEPPHPAGWRVVEWGLLGLAIAFFLVTAFPITVMWVGSTISLSTSNDPSFHPAWSPGQALLFAAIPYAFGALVWWVSGLIRASPVLRIALGLAATAVTSAVVETMLLVYVLGKAGL